MVKGIRTMSAAGVNNAIGAKMLWVGLSRIGETLELAVWGRGNDGIKSGGDRDLTFRHGEIVVELTSAGNTLFLWLDHEFLVAIEEKARPLVVNGVGVGLIVNLYRVATAEAVEDFASRIPGSSRHITGGDTLFLGDGDGRGTGLVTAELFKLVVVMVQTASQGGSKEK